MYKPPFFKTREFALAVCAVTPTDIARHLGLVTEEWDDDLGPVIATGVHLPSGQPISFNFRKDQPALQTAIYADASDVVALGVNALLNMVLEHTEISTEQVSWTQTATTDDAVRAVEMANAYRAEYWNWKVMRLDDNGNTFVLAEGLKKSDADEIVADYTARGHKQLYWAEK